MNGVEKTNNIEKRFSQTTKPVSIPSRIPPKPLHLFNLIMREPYREISRIRKQCLEREEEMVMRVRERKCEEMLM